MMQASCPSTLPNDPTVYTYYAFVSYSHKDEKWGKWIQNALERYRLPAAVRKEVGKPLPQKIHPVFRDDTDLGACRLEAGLQQELEQSRFLIVVCSPNSAKPNAEGKHWVNEEVKRFCDMGRADRVIPVIVDGTAETAFCPKIAEEGLLGLDATKHPNARILNDLVAKILGLRPDELWRREERRLRAKRRLQVFTLTLAATFVALGGCIWWDSTRTVKNYYADYVDSFGLPQGIFPLKVAELAHRHLHYRFEYQGLQRGHSPHADSAPKSIWKAFGLRRRLVRVVQANSHGYPCERNDDFFARPQIMGFDYDKNNRVCEVRHGRYNGEGQEPFLTRRIELYNDEGVVNGLQKFFTKEDQRSIDYFMSTDNAIIGGEGIEAASEISAVAVQRDITGRELQSLYLNSSLANISDGEGLNGRSFSYDNVGRVTEDWNLLQDGEQFIQSADRNGIVGRKAKYEGRNLRRITFVDENNHPIVGPNGYASREYVYDRFDNIVQVLFYDENGRKVLNEEGCAELRSTFDDCGNLVKKESLDEYGKPVLAKFGSSSWTAEYDAQGNMTRQSFFDVDGKPIQLSDGFASIAGQYDNRGNMTLKSVLGVDGKPVLDKDGCASVLWEYDLSGNKTREAYFGLRGEAVMSTDGFAETRMEYDRHGNMTKQTFFGTDGRPLRKNQEFAEMRRKFNDRGNIVEESYFGDDGAPILIKDGYASISMEYDGSGFLTTQKYFGVDGKLTLTKHNVAETRMEYDKRGYMIKRSFFGLAGKPILSDAGAACVQMEYDKHGNLTKQSCFGLVGDPIMVEGGNAGWNAKYDKYGRMIQLSYFGTDGKPVMTKDGFAMMKIRYDQNGGMFHIDYYDEFGRPTSPMIVWVCAEVIANTPASNQGVRKDDIWCCLGTYNILNGNTFSDIQKTIQETRNMEKILTVARKEFHGYKILSFHFPVGIMGIRVKGQTIHDADKLLEAYKGYCKMEKATTEK